MSTDLDELVACPGFRWMPRMQEQCGATCCKVLDGEPWLWFVDDCVTEHDGEPCHPAIDDPATLGCMLALVREAYPAATIREMTHPKGGTLIVAQHGHVHFKASGGKRFDRLAAALIEHGRAAGARRLADALALGAAPGRPE